MSELTNPFLSGANPLMGMSEGDFDLLDNVDEGLRGGLDGTAGDNFMYHYIGEDGLPYRENRTWNPNTEEMEVEQTDERVYLWSPSREQKASNKDDAAREAAMDKEFRAGSNMYYTEEEIKAQWDADEGMGYLKEQTDWDTYWGLVTATTEGVANGTIPAENWQDSPEYMALVQESGIPLQYTNDDGDVFNFNGFGYSRDYKVDDDIGVEVINGAFLGLVGSFVAGPLLASALTPALGAAGAKAASSAILSMAQDAMTTGEVDFGAALISAGMAYGGEKISDIVGGVSGDIVGQAENSELMDTIQGYIDAGYSQETIDKMYEVVQGGLDAGADATNIIDVLGDVVNGGVVEVVWDIIDEADREGEFDPDAPENPYDPSLIDPQLPQVPTEDSDGGGGGGGGDTSGGTDGDPTDSTDPIGDDTPVGGETPQGQYEVVEVREDGSVVVRDNRDGDVWILPEGDYGVGDYVPESEMGNAVGGEGELDSGDPEADGDEEEVVVDPTIPSIPGYTPPTLPTDPVETPETPPTSDTPATTPEVPGGDGSADGGLDGGSDGSGDGDSDGAGDGGGEGDGDGTGEGDGEGSGSGGGSGAGDGTGEGDGSGDGNGDGTGDGGSGMMSGHNPEWGELFGYTPFKVYEPGRGLEPVSGLLKGLLK